MSRTFRDQLRYKAKHWFDAHTWFNRSYFVEKDSLLEYITVKNLPAPKDISEPEWWKVYKFPCGNRDAKFWHKLSNRKARHRIKRLLKQESYEEAEHIKPENVDWIIC